MERSTSPTNAQANSLVEDEVGAEKVQEPVSLRNESAVTLNKKVADEDEDKVVDVAHLFRPERGRRLQFARRFPIVDSQLAQAKVPKGPFDRNLRPPPPCHPGMRVVWTGEVTSDTLSYLAFCRQLIGKAEVPATEPLEEDEQALEFLQEYGANDVERAKLLLLSSMGTGIETDMVSLMSETRGRQRVKGVFRSWIGGEYRYGPGEADVVPDAQNPAKVKALWKDWQARCRKTLLSPNASVSDLLLLQKEERQLPRFQSRGSHEEDALVSAANDASADLETRIRDLESFAARVHDSLSVIGGKENRLTTSEIKRLADEAPKKMHVKEVDLLRDLAADAENWERRAQSWLQEDEVTPAPAAGRKSGSRGRTNTANTGAQEFSLASLVQLIREGETSPIDHSQLLAALNKKRTECEHLMQMLAFHVPHEKSWKLDKKKYEILPLSQLKTLRDDLKKMKLRVHQSQVLDSHIEAAEEWIAAVKRSSNERFTIKELNSLLSKADQIPVDLSEEKRMLESFVERAVDWIRRAKAFFPPTRNQLLTATKKTRATAASEEIANFQKGNSTDFLALRDEALELGIENLNEATVALEAAETVDDWIARVKEAMENVTDEKLELLNELLVEAESLPVVVSEERALRTSAMMKNWSKNAYELINSKTGLIPLKKFEATLVEADKIVPSEPGQNKRRRLRRTVFLDNEVELRKCVEEARTWVDSANVVILPSTATGRKFETYDSVKELLQEQIKPNVEETRAKLFRRIREISKWQKHTRERLLASGAIDLSRFQSKDTCDVVLADFLEEEQTLTSMDEESDGEDEAGGLANSTRGGNGESDMQSENVPIVETVKSPKLTLEELKDMLSEAHRFGIRVPELDVIEELDLRTKTWLSKFAVVSTDPNAPSSRKRKRKAGDGLPSNSRLLLQIDDLLEMKREAEVLPIDISPRLETLEACIKATCEWRDLCVPPLERYRQLCNLMNRTSQPSEQPISTESTENTSLLEQLKIVAYDSSGVEMFPTVTEQSCIWWKDELAEDVRICIRRIREAMYEAEKRNLHTIALDSPPVRACSWLIQADNWLQEVSNSLFTPSVSGDQFSVPEPKSLQVLCQVILDGYRLMRTDIDEDLPDTFPENLLVPYMFTPSSSRDTLGQPAVKRSRHSASLNTQEPVDNEVDIIRDGSPPLSPSSIGADGELKILKYTKEITVSEAECHPPSRHNRDIGSTVMKRLYGLQKIAQSCIASRALANNMSSIPRNERSLSKLRSNIEKTANWSRIVDMAEDPRFKQEIQLAEQWTYDMEAILKSNKTTVDQLEKLASRGEKVWVDFRQIEFIRKRATDAKDWISRVENSGLEQGKSTIESLTKLLQEGEKLRGVDLKAQLAILRKATEILCMCRGGRDNNMMVCIDCEETFHRGCIKDFSPGLCPICSVIRGLDIAIGLGNLSLCRAYVLENSPDVIIPEPEKRQSFINWMKEMRVVVEGMDNKGAVKIDYRQPPLNISKCYEVIAVLNCITAKTWIPKFERLRHRPTLDEVDEALQTLPKDLIPSEYLAALEDIQSRGKKLRDEYARIWNAHVDTPSSEIVKACNKALEKLDSLPLEFSAIRKHLQACADDGAQRYCICNSFDNGLTMVSCDSCKKWFHVDCVGLSGLSGDEVQEYYCTQCRPAMMLIQSDGANTTATVKTD